MISAKSKRSWKNRTAVFLALAMTVSISIPSVRVSAAATKNVPAKAISLNVEDDVRVLVIGKTYDIDYVLSPETSKDAVTFKSSNTAVATVSATGEVTAKKRGVVTIVATTKKGKKAWKKLYVVNGSCTTQYQNTINQMLLSSNITKFVIKNTKTEKDYIIKKGDYCSKTVYVNAPKSDVKNYGTFKEVNIVDVAEGTWREHAKGNTINVSDKDLHLVVAPVAQVTGISFTADNAKVELQASGDVDKVNVTGTNTQLDLSVSKTAKVKTLNVKADKAKLTVKADGSFDKIVIDSKADVVIEGNAEKVTVQLTKNAEGACVESSVPVEASVAAKATITLNKGAENSTVVKSDDKVSVTVKNNTEAPIIISTGGSEKKEEVAPDTTNTPKETNPVDAGSGSGGSSGGSNNGPTTTTAAVTGVSSDGGKTATYTLPVSITNLKSAQVIVGSTVNKTYNVNSDVLKYVNNLLSNESLYINAWKSLNGSLNISKGDLTVTVEGISGVTKTVTFDGIKYTVTINEAEKSITVIKEGSTVAYTLSKTGNSILIITSATNTDVAALVTFKVTY